jgi:predicted acylesterase/phospholipase RssA
MRLPIANPARFLYRARYARHPLAAAFDNILAERASIRLNDISTPLLIAAVNTDTGKPSIFMSRGLDGNAQDVIVKDALLATSAAPTYFPPHATVRGTFVDGGLIANAPDLVAVTETVRKLGCDLDRTRVLSVGTAGSPHVVTGAGREPGVISWLLARGLVQLTLSAQEQLAIDQCGVLLGNRFLRLDEQPSSNESPTGLDKADPNTTEKLRCAAEATIGSMATKHRAAIRRFLSHRSQGPRRPPLG